MTEVLKPLNRAGMQEGGHGKGTAGLAGAPQGVGAASLSLPLRKDLFATKSKGDATPTFTRATAATVTDHEGVIREVNSGEARFEGARRVENLLAADSSNDLSVANWNKIGTATVAGTNVANFPAENDEILQTKSITVVPGDTHVFSATMSGTGTITMTIYRNTGTGEGVIQQVTLSETPQRFSVKHTWVYDHASVYVRVSRPVGDTATTVTIEDTQLENVTGASDTTIPSEYVSTMYADYAGNLGPELVTNGDFTDWTADSPDNWTDTEVGDATSNITESSGAVRILSDGTATYTTQTVTTSGTTYFYSIDVLDATTGGAKLVSGATEAGPFTTTGTKTGTFVAAAAGLSLSRNTGATDVTVDNVSVKKIIFPAGVVGVKYFSYANGNTVSSNVVTEATGVALATLQYDDWAASTTYRPGQLVIAEESPSWFLLRATKYATSDTTIPTSLAVGTPVVDAGQTWEVIAEYDGEPNSQMRGYLAEGARTNLVVKSEDFNDAQWPKSASTTATEDAAASPDGATTADNISASGGTGSIWDVVTVVAETEYTFSWYAKDLNGAAVYYRVYDVTNAGDITATTAYTSSVADSSWTRITHTFTTPAGCVSVNIYPVHGLPDGANIDIWGAQLEAGSAATSYIPTSGATATRNADVLTYPSAGNISDTAGSVVATIEATDAAAGFGVTRTGNGRIMVQNGTNWLVYDGTNTVQLPVLSSQVETIVGTKWSTAGLNIFADGVAATAGSYDGTMGSGDIGVGHSSGGNHLYGTIRDINIYSRAYPDATMQELTTAPVVEVDPFAWPLISDIFPTGWTSDVAAPTFTRATAATVTDHEGVIRETKLGEMRFMGARRVENLLAAESSDDWEHASWVGSTGGAATDTNTLTLPNNYSSVLQDYTITVIPGDKYIHSVTMSGTGTISMRIEYRGTATETTDINGIVLSATPTRYAVGATAVSANTTVRILVYRNVGETATAVTIEECQLENVTGASDTTIPSEYVSTMYADYAGNLGPELVTNGTFDADSDWTKGGGWAISGGTANGTNVAGTLIYQNAGAAGSVQYLTQFTLSNHSDGEAFVRFLGTTNTSGTSRTADGTYTEIITTHSSANGNYGVVGSSSFDGSIDNLSLKKIIFPAGVVGVKYFSYANGNTVASNVVTEAQGTPIADATLRGYLAEGARTNSVLQSRQFDTTWAATTTNTQNAVGIDGGTVAWTLEDDDGAVTRSSTQAIAIANNANTHVYSVYVKKDATPTAYPLLRINYANGTQQNAGVVVDVVNGAVTDWVAGAPTGSGISDAGDYWRVWLSLANNNTGNTSMTVYIYPAAAETFTGTTANAALGSNVFDAAQVELNASFPSTPIHTTTTTATRNSDALTFPAAGILSSTAGSAMASIQPFADVGLSQHFIETNFVYINAGDTKFRSYDGANFATGPVVSNPYTTRHRTGVSYGPGTTFTHYTDGTAGTPGTFDGDIAGVTGLINICSPSNTYATIRNILIYIRKLIASKMENLTS